MHSGGPSSTVAAIAAWRQRWGGWQWRHWLPEVEAGGRPVRLFGERRA